MNVSIAASARRRAARGGCLLLLIAFAVLCAGAARAGAAPPAVVSTLAQGHAYRHGVVPPRGQGLTSASGSAGNLAFGGGISGVGVTNGPPRVYLVFWGSQWGAQSTDGQGNVTLAGDPNAMAPYLQRFIRGIGTGGETWSGVMTQYCQDVSAGAQSCPTSSTQHVGYPTGGALAGVWVDESSAAPSQASGNQIGAEAVRAATHFGNTNQSANLAIQYVIVSPTGTHPDGFNTRFGKFCAWHDYTGDSTLSGGAVSSPDGQLAFTNLPYLTDMGSSCGENFVNSGGGGALDGVSIVEGHEYAETLTDQFPAGGWSDASGNENGDKCAWISSGQGAAQDISLTTGTFAVQSTWANDYNGGAGGCEVTHPIVTNNFPSAPQGSWVGSYGAGGYDLAAWNGGGDVVSMPNASVSLLQGNRWEWGSNNSDGRLLESVDKTSRVAATYYDANEIQVQLSFSAAFTGNLELYALDADYGGRRETITVGSQTANLNGDFSQGAWAIFPISVTAGSTLTIKVDRVAGPNAVLGGIMLGGGGTPPPMVQTQPQGSWVGSYGAGGYDLAAWNAGSDVASMSNTSVSLLQGNRYEWGSNSSDGRQLESPDKTTRVAAAYYDPNEIQVQLSFTAAFTGNLELYALDADYGGRRETITVGTQTVSLSSDFSQGAWAIFPISVAAGSSVTIKVDRVAGPNAVLAGIFLGTGAPATTSNAPPPAGGYFSLQPVGSWSSLASDSQCGAQVHRSTWEPRPENAQQNNTMPAPGAMAVAFAARPRDQGGSYDSRWDTWLLPRVDGQFTGTTDEILQWAACKWGLPDDLVRADAVVESTWFQYLHFANDGSFGGGGGSCYWNRGCGDAFSSSTTASTTYCQGIASQGLASSTVHDYQLDPVTSSGGYPYTPQSGMCPKTFSILGIMSWDNPAWQAPYPAYPGNQNGTFPFTRDSTAAAADYWGAYMRGCYEGWESWLKNTGTGTYAPGDIWGCIGSWYSGAWHDSAANTYISQVQSEENNQTWLTPSFDDSRQQYSCDPKYACPT